MKALLLRLYARRHLGRALAITGAVIVTLGNLGMLIPNAANIPFLMIIASAGTLMTLPAYLLIAAAPVIGLTTMRANRRNTPTNLPDFEAPAESTDPDPEHAHLGRLLAFGGLAVMFSPLLPVLIFAPTMSEGPGSAVFMWFFMFTIPAGGILIAGGAIRGLLTMTRNQKRRH